MELKNYSKEALRTESIVDNISGISCPSIYSALLAVVAVGDVIDQIKKTIFYGKQVDQARMLKDIESAVEFLRDISKDISDNNLTDPGFADSFLTELYGIEVGPDQAKSIDTRILHVVLGVVSESAEMAKSLTKNIEGEPIDMVNMSEEIGDLNWYANGIFPDASGISYQKYLETNIVKLAVRYPDKFSSWLALDENRNLVEERKALVAGML